MSIPSEYSKIIAHLIDATDKHQIDWKESTSRRGTVCVIVGGSTIQLSSTAGLHQADRDTPTVTRGGSIFGSQVLEVMVEVLDAQATLIDAFSVRADQGDTPYSSMKGLYDKALRKARKVDQIIREIERELDKRS